MSKRSVAASLRHSVTVQSNSSTRDAVGQPATAWAGTTKVRCSIETMQGNESVYALGQQAQVSHKIVVRAYEHGITTASRLMYAVDGKSRFFLVVSIVDTENLGFMQHILAKEVVA
jgi:SPP1 family predicted phage head-tail adaptor